MPILSTDIQISALLENMYEGYAECRILYNNNVPLDFEFICANKAFLKAINQNDVIGKSVSRLVPDLLKCNPDLITTCSNVVETGNTRQIKLLLQQLQLNATVYRLDELQFAIIFEDITKYIQEQNDYQVVNDIYEILTKTNDLHKTMAAITKFLKKWSGCESIGIRLHDGDDYPYFETSGFSDEFVEKEKYLCSMDQNGKIEYNDAGEPVLECMCGSLLCGKFDPSKPYFTHSGSFYTNSATEMSHDSQSSYHPDKTRGRCVAQGYESIALIPLRAAGQTYGLLQINSRQKEMFTDNRISLLERIARKIAITLSNRYMSEALEISEERWKFALEGLGDGIWDWDFDSGKIFFSNQWKMMHGFDESDPELSLDDWKNRIHPDDYALVRSQFNKHMNGLISIYICEYRIRCKDNSYKWILDRGKIVSWSMDRKPKRFIGIHSDITERKQTENDLHINDELLRMTGVIAKIGGWEFDTQTMKGTWTDEAASIHDLTPEIQPSLEMGVSLYTNDSRLKIEKAISEAIRCGKPYDLELEIQTVKDRKKWVRTMGLPIVENGRVVKVRSIFQDITESKITENNLNAEKERLAVTLRSIGDGVITTDTNGNILMLNNVAEELTGWKSDEAIGHPLPDVFNIINEQTRHKCENPVEKVLKSGSIVELANHTCLVSRTGNEMVIADSGAPIRDKDNNIIGVILVFRDMTEKQKINDSLLKAQKLESIGVLAGGIAHDFNNLLGGLFGYIEMATQKLNEMETESARQLLEKALLVFERARALTRQLLTFSKGGSPLRKTVEIGPLLRNWAQFVLSGSNIECKFLISSNLWRCDCDENQIGQVMDNIIINAKQAMPNGGEIIISANNVTGISKQNTNTQNCDFIKISVQDQGTGIPKEVLSRIFDPFFSTKDTGHGLGLATAFSIIQRHDGWIDVESQPGKGATFHVFLPAKRITSMKNDTNGRSESNECGSVLVMDDEEFILDILNEILEGMGYTVFLTKEGNQALEVFKKAEIEGQPISVCILDLTIPGEIGGREVVKKIKEIRPNAKVIASSGYSEDPVMSQPKEHGFTDRLVKPFRKNDLIELFKRLSVLKT